MWRWLLAAIGALFIVVVLTNAQTQQAIGQAKNGIYEWFDSAANIPEQRMLGNLRDEFLHNNLSLQTHQTDYVFKITESQVELNKFYQLYCVRDDKNPFIFGANKTKLCSQIKKSGLIN